MNNKNQIKGLKLLDGTLVEIGLKDAVVIIRENGEQFILLPKGDEEFVDSDSPSAIATVLAVVMRNKDLYMRIFNKYVDNPSIRVLVTLEN